MHRQARRRFFRRRPTKKIETEVVPHDSGQERGIRAAAVKRMPAGVVLRRFDRRPVGRPQRIDAGGAIPNLGDVAAFFEDRHAQRVVLDDRRATVAVGRRQDTVSILQPDPRGYVHASRASGRSIACCAM